MLTQRPAVHRDRPAGRSGITAIMLAAVLAIAGCSTGASTAGQAGSSSDEPASSPATSPVAAGPTTTSDAPGAPATPGTTFAPPGTSTPSPGRCHARGSGGEVLPDPSCTPGATNPAVTPATIHQTICARGWTATVRPPESYTEPLKRQQMAAYGDTGPISSYEEDHLIPLELGGSPSSPSNLWPEPGASPNPKDAVEGAARRAVCDGRLGLAAAQTAMATNWVSLGQQLGVG